VSRQAEGSQDQRQQQQQAESQQQSNLPAAAERQADVNVQRSAAQLQSNAFGMQFGEATAQGLTIASIEPNSVFFHNGLRPHDVLVAVSGQPVRTFVDFQRFVSIHPGQRIPVIVLRGGRHETIYITPPANLAAPQQQTFRVDLEAERANQLVQSLLGITLDPKFPEAALVVSVNPGGPGNLAGLQTGDIITALNDYGVKSQQDVALVLRQMQPAQRINISYTRRVRNLTEAVLAHSPATRPHTVGYAPQSVLRQVIAEPVAASPAAPTYVPPTTYVAPTYVQPTYVAPVAPTYVGPMVVRPPYVAGRPIYYNGGVRPAVPYRYGGVIRPFFR
jgi:predicted metalloprotease with PDZ domain